MNHGCEGNPCTQTANCQSKNCLHSFCSLAAASCNTGGFRAKNLCEGAPCKKDQQCASYSCIGGACSKYSDCATSPISSIGKCEGVVCRSGSECKVYQLTGQGDCVGGVCSMRQGCATSTLATSGRCEDINCYIDEQCLDGLICVRNLCKPDTPTPSPTPPTPTPIPPPPAPPVAEVSSLSKFWDDFLVFFNANYTVSIIVISSVGGLCLLSCIACCICKCCCRRIRSKDLLLFEEGDQPQNAKKKIPDSPTWQSIGEVYNFDNNYVPSEPRESIDGKRPNPSIQAL